MLAHQQMDMEICEEFFPIDTCGRLKEIGDCCLLGISLSLSLCNYYVPW